MSRVQPRSTSSEIYPRYCFDLAPTHGKWSFLRGCDILDLAQPEGYQGQDWFFFRNLPIRWVRIVGVVVAVEDFKTRRIYTIDDSSGVCIEGITTGKFVPGNNHISTDTDSLQQADPGVSAQAAAPSEHIATAATAQIEFPYDFVDIGSVVDIKGKLATFREERQVKIEKLAAVSSTAQEVTLWQKRNSFHAEILSKPWVLSPELVRKLRKQAERSEDQVEKRRKRHRGRAEEEPEPITKKADTQQDQQGTQAALKNTDKTNGRSQKDSKQRRLAAQRADIAKMIHSGGVQGKFSALGL